jgi:hypothetical protein
MDPQRPRPAQPAHETRFHYSKPNYAQPSQYQQFPPHPGVRVPPNVKLSARKIPAGVGVAPPPVRYESPPRQEIPQQASQMPTGNGVLTQDFKFPAAPPIPATYSTRSRQEPFQSPGRRNNTHDSYMSSVANDYTTGMTPGSRSRGFPTPTSRRYSGSVYPESEALGVDERYEPDAQYSPEPTQTVVRQASLGKRAKPAITNIRNRDSQVEQHLPSDFPLPPGQPSRKATVEALSAAVAQGMSGQPHVGSRSETPVSRSHTPIRMPFDSSPPGSPSVETEFMKTPKSLNTNVSSKMLGRTPGSSHSQKSTNPLLGLGIEQPSMSDKIPASRRPPRLDMDAVREAEARGSTTSLADLIKRATKLAANLDRGKTASRLGMLDMFGSSEKLGMAGANNRHSTMSDMLSAFPAPAIGGTPTNKRDTAWPLGEKGEGYNSTTDLSRGQRGRRRKCCGMSLPVFIVVVVVIIILIAAAVLIPIFLILVPNQHKSNNALGNCASSHPCHNGGTSIVSGNACACVCANGFTGSQCATSGNTDDCLTVTLSDGDIEYKNATVGSSIWPSLSNAQTRFDIALNVSTILSVFSSGNLSCTSENSIVDFNSSVLSQGSKMRRFVMLPGFEPPPPAAHGHPHGPQITARAEVDCVDEHLEKRQDADSAATSTQNGIVFQASSPSIGAVPTTPAVTGGSTVTSESGTVTPTASATSSTAALSQSASPTSGGPAPTGTVTDQEIEFARVVVLFVLQETQAVSVAVNAQQQMESFFSQQTKGNATSEKVDVGMGNLSLTADFTKFSITKGDGEVIGGQENSG